MRRDENDTYPLVVLGCAILTVLFWLAVFGAVVYVGWHFLSKVW